MLKQLLKYEFKATCGYYGSAYLVLLASALLLGLGATHMPQAEMETVWAIMALVYMGTILAIIVLTVQQIIQRFTGNLLGREGYLMHTLPVSPAQLILSKLLSSAVWGICSLCVGVLSVVVLMLASQPEFIFRMGELFSLLVGVLGDFPEETGYVISLLAGAFLTFLAWAACQVLRVYACCMVGQPGAPVYGAGGDRELFCDQCCTGLAGKTGGGWRHLAGGQGAGTAGAGPYAGGGLLLLAVCSRVYPDAGRIWSFVFPGNGLDDEKPPEPGVIKGNKSGVSGHLQPAKNAAAAIERRGASAPLFCAVGMGVVLKTRRNQEQNVTELLDEIGNNMVLFSR